MATFVETIVSSDQMLAMTGSPRVIAFHKTPKDAALAHNQPIDTTHGSTFAAGQAGGFYNRQSLGQLSGWSDAQLAEGAYFRMAFTHELGHGLGLKHPHDAFGSVPTLPGVKNGAATTLGTNQQNHQFWSVMFYNANYGFDAAGHVVLRTGNPLTDSTAFGYVEGPMAYDVAAIQHLYGVNTTTGADDTAYDLPGADGAGTGWVCIWDTGGNDTLRYAGAADAILDLTAATLDGTATGGGVLSYAARIHGGYTIANGVVIENASGGSGNDRLVGNQADNTLDGGSGNDTLVGGGGRDTIIGGDGNDLLVGDAETAPVPVAVGFGSGTVTHDYGNTSIATALLLDGSFSLGADVYIDGSTTRPHVGVHFLSPATGPVVASYYALTLGAGVSVMLDIDHASAGFDSWIRLLDSNGGVLASNDDAAGDPGSAGLVDSRIVFTVSATATYYVSVGQWATVYGDTLPNGVGYDLDVSVWAPATPGSAGTAAADRFDGGDGIDTLSYAGATATVAVRIDLGAGYGGEADGDLYAGIENVVGSPFDDTLVGDGLANLLTGGGGSDVLFGMGGEDWLVGGSAASGGYNQLWGGPGSDTASYAGTTGTVYADLALFCAFLDNGAGYLLTDTYNAVENLLGSSGVDVLIGDGGDNAITGAAGADQLYGRDGADIFVYRGWADSNLIAGYDTIADFVVGVDRIDLSALHLDASHVVILSDAGATSFYVESTAGTFNVATDVAIAFIGANALTMADILF